MHEKNNKKLKVAIWLAKEIRELAETSDNLIENLMEIRVKAIELENILKNMENGMSRGRRFRGLEK